MVSLLNWTQRALLAGLVIAASAPWGAAQTAQRNASTTQNLPRTADGHPDFQGIWQADTRAQYGLEDHGASHGILPAKGVVVDGAIPYLPASRQKQIENFKNREKADPLNSCYFPGIPRIMYLDHPFQIFQTPDHIAMTFEWSQVYRLIYVSAKPAMYELESWMGSNRARWEGDTLVVVAKDFNEKTWFDKMGNHHSGDLKVTERYSLVNPDTIQYEATIEDPKTFSKPWTIRFPIVRKKNVERLMEYHCQAELEESTGLFERDPRLWYPDAGAPASPLGKPEAIPTAAALPDPKPTGTFPRLATGPDKGKPNLTAYYSANSGGANYGLEQHERDFLTPGTRGVVIDPADRTLPYRDWARKERIERELPHRGYDDHTAHCFVAGVPRGIYTPSPMQILQPPGYVVMLFERMAWRIIPTTPNAKHQLPEHVRLWQGDSIGRWEGDTLVVDTTNLNGRLWLNEVGDVMSYAAHVVERFIPMAEGKITWRATVSDPIPYTRPWTIEMPLDARADELLEVACHEDDVDLPHLKDVRDEYRAKQKEQQK